MKNINPLLTSYAEDNNITLILEKKNILVGVKALDVTNDILNLLNKIPYVAFTSSLQSILMKFFDHFLDL